MNDAQLGALFRAVRIHLRLRQEDVAAKARVSVSTVSRIERGHMDTVPVRLVRAVAAALEIRLDSVPTWKGGDLERLTNARHTALHERLAGRLASAAGWVSAAEVSYSIWGERGVIDRLAYHGGRRVLGVFEIKPDLGDPAGLIAQLDRYRRLSPEIARERGWDADRVSCWAIVADTDTNRRRLRAYSDLLRGALPGDSPAFRLWLTDPSAPIHGLVFLAYPHPQTGTRQLSTVKRVRVTSPRSGRG
jgi:transcriptional regulator with XRE-family HTH domain